jgi:hypothetical protein
MSKAEKLEYLDALEKKQELARRKRPPYEPHAAQMKVHASTALERYLFCGNGFGKTTILVNEIHWAATGYNPVTKAHATVPAKIYVVVDDPGKIGQIIIPEYRKWNDLPDEWLSKEGKPHYSKITYENGSEIHFLTHEVNLLKLEGVEMDYLFFDEPPPRHVFIGLFRGGRISDLKVLLSGTPLYQPWLRTEVYEPWLDGERADIECFSGDTDDNPNLAEKYKERFGRYLTENEKATRFRGQFFDASGQALAHLWQRKYHRVSREKLKWREGNPCVIAMDPHSSKPHHAVLLGVDRDNHFVVLDAFKDRAVAREFINLVIGRGWLDNYKVIDIIYDSSGNADSTSGEGYRTFGEVVNEELKRQEYGQARGTTYEEKSDEDFIEKIKDIVKVPEKPNNFGEIVPRLRVVDEPGNIYLKGVETDFLQVQWQYDKKRGENKEKLEISNRDWLACIKYALATNLYFTKTRDKAFYYKKQLYGFKTKSQRKKRFNFG